MEGVSITMNNNSVTFPQVTGCLIELIYVKNKQMLQSNERWKHNIAENIKIV